MSTSVALGQFAAVLTGDIVQGVQRDCDVAPTAQVIDRSFAGNAEYPCRQASGGVVATVVSPDLVEDSLEDVVGVIVADKSLEIPAYRCPEREIDLADRLLPVVSELGSETVYGLARCHLHRRNACRRSGRPCHAPGRGVRPVRRRALPLVAVVMPTFRCLYANAWSVCQ